MVEGGGGLLRNMQVYLFAHLNREPLVLARQNSVCVYTLLVSVVRN